MKISKILWPTDFSSAATAAEPYVLSLATAYDAEVHLIHVGEDLTAFEHYWGSGPDSSHLHDLQERSMKLARERLENLCSERLSSCKRYHIHIVMGHPAKTILTTIDNLDIDLVIMATHGMRGAFPFGSVAERVVKNSPVPVLTVNPHDFVKKEKSA